MVRYELYILPSALGRPSLSGACIAVFCLCSIYLQPEEYKVIESMDLSIGMPALKVQNASGDGYTWHRGFFCIRSVLIQNGVPIDSNLDQVGKNASFLWESLIEEVCDPVIWNQLFISSPNYLNATRPEVSKAVGLPHAFYFPTELRAYAFRRCSEISSLTEDTPVPSSVGFDTRESLRQARIQSQAHHLYDRLETELLTIQHAGLWAYAETPNSLDAVLYGYLAFHFVSGLGYPNLQSHMEDVCPRLRNYMLNANDWFESRRELVHIEREGFGLGSLFRGWGQEPGKRPGDLLPVLGFAAAIFASWLYDLEPV